MLERTGLPSPPGYIALLHTRMAAAGSTRAFSHPKRRKITLIVVIMLLVASVVLGGGHTAAASSPKRNILFVRAALRNGSGRCCPPVGRRPAAPGSRDAAHTTAHGTRARTH